MNDIQRLIDCMTDEFVAAAGVYLNRESDRVEVYHVDHLVWFEHDRFGEAQTVFIWIRFYNTGWGTGYYEPRGFNIKGSTLEACYAEAKRRAKALHAKNSLSTEAPIV